MYCTNCQCEFDGWYHRCPQCRNPLGITPELSLPTEMSSRVLSYDELVERVRSKNHLIEIDVLTSEVVVQRRWRFPYLGYGYAWAKRFQGGFEDIHAALTTVEEGRHKEWRFPYFGFGYAWPMRLSGHISGNPILLTVNKVRKERKMRFPYLGYGFSWAESFSGECGPQLSAHLRVTDAHKKMEWRFPFFGFGFAWENKAVFSLSLAE